jgi:phosphoglycolate phosphatase
VTGSVVGTLPDVTSPLPTSPELVIFDLDGTLCDTAAGIMAHLARALEVAGLDVPPPDVLRGCVGPHWPEFLPTIGVPPDRYDDVVGAYRSTYDHEAPALALPFPGIPEMLRALDDAGLSLAVATSKPQHLADAIVGDGPLGRWIPTVLGADPEAGRHVKADVVGAVLDAVPEVAPEATVMVGDRHHDVHGAAAHGIGTVGVRWGCAPPGELEEAGAVAVVDTPEHLAALLLGD